MGAILPHRGEVTPSGEKFFIVAIFRKKTSKYTKLIIEPYIYDNLNRIYRFFFIFNEKILKLL